MGMQDKDTKGSWDRRQKKKEKAKKEKGLTGKKGEKEEHLLSYT